MDIWQSIELQMFIRYAVTLIGAAAMYIFSLHKGFEGAISFLKLFFPDRSETFYDRLDFVLVTFLGSFIGFIFFAPTTTPQALAAGFGWVGAFNVLMHKDANKGDRDNG